MNKTRVLWLISLLAVAASPCIAASDNRQAAMETYSQQHFACPEKIADPEGRFEYLANTFEQISDINPRFGGRRVVAEYVHFLLEHHCQQSLATLTSPPSLATIHRALWQAIPAPGVKGHVYASFSP